MGIVARDDFGRFAVGSEAAAAARRVHRALERALAADDWRRLHQGMDRLADAFADGQPWALDMVMSRLAGKPTQRIETASADARELDLAAVMQLVLQARASIATDATTLAQSDDVTASVTQPEDSLKLSDDAQP